MDGGLLNLGRVLALPPRRISVTGGYGQRYRRNPRGPLIDMSYRESLNRYMHTYQDQLDAANERQAQKKTKRFVRGPISLDWLSRAFSLPGKAGAIGLALWWRAGLTKSQQELCLTAEHVSVFGVTSRHGRVEALRRLEEAGLIRVHRHANRAPRVDIIDDPAQWISQRTDKGVTNT